MKILITGCNGQLGRALAEALPEHSLSLLDLPEIDIADPDSVEAQLAATSPDWVINAAAFTDVDGAESDPEGAERGNAQGPHQLALATARREIPIIHVSTDYVFDGETDRPYLESDPPHPKTVYGRTKLAGEEAICAGNTKHFIVRTAWLYSTTGRNFALTMLGLAERESVRVVDDQTGSPTYAPHLARGIARLVGSDDYGLYHMAGAGQTTWCGLTRALYRALDVPTKVEPVTTDEFPRPAPRPRYSALATGRDGGIGLPAWEDGVRDFAARIREERS